MADGTTIYCLIEGLKNKKILRTFIRRIKYSLFFDANSYGYKYFRFSFSWSPQRLHRSNRPAPNFQT